MVARIHPTADVSSEATVGDGTSIWQHVQIREGAIIGRNCNLGKGVFVDLDVKIGDNVKIQNYVSVFEGVEIENGVMVGPHVCFTNDLLPRAINPDGTLKNTDDWLLTKTRICEGAGLGANSTIICGVIVGKWALVGSGSVVTRNVPDYGLVYGNPARLRGFVGPSGQRLIGQEQVDKWVVAVDPETAQTIRIPAALWEMADNVSIS